MPARRRHDRLRIALFAATAFGVGLAPWASHASVEQFTGTVFNDLNGDGSSNGGTDPGLSGWTLNLLDSTNTIVATTTSGASGAFSFFDPTVGALTLKEVAPAGWIGTLPAGGSYAIPASPLTDVTGLDFGNFQTVSVSGTVYDDLDGNGQENPGEPALAGQTAEVFDSGNNLVGTANSDASGGYTVVGIGPGSFTLHVATLPGETVTQPSNPDFYSFTSSSGVNVVGGIFGVTGVPTVPEPVSLAVFGVALAGLGAARRRRGGG